MILSTVVDRLTAFTARGRSRRAEAALRARAMREISAQLFPRRVCGCFERDSNIHVWLSFETANACKGFIVKKEFCTSGKSELAKKCTVCRTRSHVRTRSQYWKYVHQICIKLPGIALAAFFFAELQNNGKLTF